MSQNKKRVYVSAEAYLKLKDLMSENKEKLAGNRGMCGMIDILVLGETTSEGSGRHKKIN